MTISLNRQQRVAQEIKKKISIILQREINDPRIQIMTTISGVEVSRDLAYAKVLVCFVNNEDEKSVKNYIKILQKASGFIRVLLSKNMRLRVIPELIFLYDNSFIEGIRMANIINKVVKNNKYYIN